MSGLKCFAFFFRFVSFLMHRFWLSWRRLPCRGDVGAKRSSLVAFNSALRSLASSLFRPQLDPSTSGEFYFSICSFFRPTSLISL